MKKWIIIPILVLMIAAFIAIQEVKILNEQFTCINCHDFNHNDSSLLQRHLEKSINCIDCHSGSGFKSYVNARKELIDAILIVESAPLLKLIIQNDSYNTKIVHLKSNCTKCHSYVESKFYDHTNISDCNKCHDARIEFTYNGSLQKMGTGGHKNKTCEDCHSTNFTIPECADCHKAHKEMEQWTNHDCLDCHNSPHIPILNGSFNTGIVKEKCSVCHEGSYKTLTFYNSRHNELKSCVNCHPVHKEKKKCFDCHEEDHTSHPFAQNNCNVCHGRSSCSDCHKDPHEPLRGLPKITTRDQFNDYAAASH